MKALFLIAVLFLMIVTSAIFLGMTMERSQVRDVPAPAIVQPAAEHESLGRLQKQLYRRSVRNNRPKKIRPKEVVKETVIEKTYVERIVVVPQPSVINTVAEPAYAPPPVPNPAPIYARPAYNPPTYAQPANIAPPVVYYHRPMAYGNTLRYGQNFQWAYRAPLGRAAYGHFHGWR